MSVYRSGKLRGLDLTKVISDALLTYFATRQPPPFPDADIADD